MKGRDRWSLQVSDTGPGIPKDAQAYIFNPFRQVDGSATRHHEGSGLGLSIVKQLANLLGGEITLTSGRGQGSTFTVTLPVVLEQEETA
jgi:signal transduction histidine kinase